MTKFFISLVIIATFAIYVQLEELQSRVQLDNAMPQTKDEESQKELDEALTEIHEINENMRTNNDIIRAREAKHTAEARLESATRQKDSRQKDLETAREGVAAAQNALDEAAQNALDNAVNVREDAEDDLDEE
ncbi:unnamed protein product [Schistosoma turkestanicum]|nr:unnamed protein product [Schistosoma turkestanicum]